MQRLVLVGGGHAHLFVLKTLAKQQLKNLEVILLTPQPYQVYSSMLPGWMTRHYTLEQCKIDLRPLAQAANAQLILHKAVQMNAMQHQITLEDGSVLDYDWLSLDIGSESNLAGLVNYQDWLVPIRPITHFIEAWEQIQRQAKAKDGFHLAIAGGGAAGVELAFAANETLKRLNKSTQITLLASEQGLLANHHTQVAHRITRRLKRLGIHFHQSPDPATEHSIPIEDGSELSFDCVIAATGTQAPRWLQSSFLKLDAEGYIAVDEHHRSCSHYNVFAAGDVCSRDHLYFQRSGAHAVHAGVALAQNLLNAASGEEEWDDYMPNPHTMYLIGTGNKQAVMSWGNWVLQGRLMWYLKKFIDQRFIRSHQ